MKYDKLVRDKIPEIITKTGKAVKYRVVTDDTEYKKYLDRKLEEEIEEYLLSGNPEELIDIEDVLSSLKRFHCENYRYEMEHSNKIEEKGLFRNRICLLEVSDD